MNINGKPYQSIWPSLNSVHIIDQTRLPYELIVLELRHLHEVEFAIKSMQVRGAPLIGVTAAYGIYLQTLEDSSDAAIKNACQKLLATRPTAVNLQWALTIMKKTLLDTPLHQRVDVAKTLANNLLEDDIRACKNIGKHGLSIIEKIYKNKQNTCVNILTHCNAGWLATVDWGTALAPIYAAHQAHIPVHVWVDETRPRNQGASLTAYELGSHGIPHTVIADNVGGHLMQHGQVDMCIVGSDRCTNQGDICNKIGTYLKALAAFDNQIPFYAALPISTIDWEIKDGLKEIIIEERHSEEVTHISGVASDGSIQKVRIVPTIKTPVANYGFDVTPAKYITGIITPYGIYQANSDSLDVLREHLLQKENPCKINTQIMRPQNISLSI